MFVRSEDNRSQDILAKLLIPLVDGPQDCTPFLAVATGEADNDRVECQHTCRAADAAVADASHPGFLAASCYNGRC